MTQKLNAKQKAFCEEYIIDHNATQAAIRANYSEHTARQQGARVLTKVVAKEYIAKLEAKETEKRKATADEVLEFYASMMRGEIEEEVIVVESGGEIFGSKAVKKTKKAQPKDRMNAAKEIAKRLGIDKPAMSDTVPMVVIEDTLPECDDE